MNGRSHLPMREFSIKTGVEPTGRAVGGRIHEVDPAAFEHFKSVLANQPARKHKRPLRPGIDLSIQQKAEEHINRAKARKLAEAFAQKQAPETIPDETIEETMMSDEVEVTNEQLMACHKRYMAAKESLRVIAADVNVSWQALQAMFMEAGLPKRDGSPFRAFNGGRPKKKAKVKETAVAPQLSNGNISVTAVDPAHMADQLEAIQQLMSTIGNVENIRVAGTIRIELSAEMVF